MSERSRIKSLDAAFVVLRPLVEERRAMPLRQIAEACGIDRSRVFKYLAGFVEAGLVVQDGESGDYRLGPFAAQIGVAALSMVDPERLGREAVVALMAETGITSALCCWSEAGPLVLSVAAPPSAIFAGLRLGALLPMDQSATGRVFLAYGAAGKAEYGDVPEKVLEGIRRDGIAFVEGSVMNGMSGAAAPVLDHTGMVRFTLTIVAPSQTREVATAASALVTAAHKLGTRLGYVG